MRHGSTIGRILRVAALACATAMAAQGIGAMAAAPGTAGAGARREIVLVPSPDRRVRMRTLVLRPPGKGPFPLAVINHGSTQNADRRAAMAMPEYHALTQWFLRRGYVVALPQRPGHGRTGGPYLEDQRGCERADYERAGFAVSDSIETAVVYLTAQPYVKRDGVVVVGQSAGGWGALAFATRNPHGVAAIVNFAGGRGGRSLDRPNNNCAPDRLVQAARAFGRKARVPTLWIYTENDSYFSPALSRQMAEAYRAAGGRVEYRLLPAFGSEGHRLADARGGEKLWGPVLEAFLAGLK